MPVQIMSNFLCRTFHRKTVFLQWPMVAIVIGCALFVTSHCDVKFTFLIQLFGEVCGHNAYHSTRRTKIYTRGAREVYFSMNEGKTFSS